MMTLKIAVRGILRNRRRSLTTCMTIAVGAVALLLIGALMTYMVLDFQTATVRRSGHLTVFRTGFFDYGAGNPSAYGIADYGKLVTLIRQDSDLKPMLAVVTPYQAVFGLAGNYKANVSKAFFGQGVVPADRRRLRQWNDYGIEHFKGAGWPLPDNPDAGLVGSGLSRILGVCGPLHVPRCPKIAEVQRAAGSDVAGLPNEDFSQLTDAPADKTAPSNAYDPSSASDPEPMPKLDLLAATADGAPNVVSMYVHHAEFQGIKDIDDNFVVMNLLLAQKLVYGAGAPKATGVIIQLNHTRDVPAARARLQQLIAQHKLDLEVRDFTELTPLYNQAIAFFQFLFSFFMSIIGLTVLFTVINAVGMSVIERTSEIGTMRALGSQRADIRRQFLLEGAVLGLAGATAGIVLALLISTVINHAGIMWSPPTAGDVVPLHLAVFGNPFMLAGVWSALVILGALAAYWPAKRAADLQVIEALRHV